MKKQKLIILPFVFLLSLGSAWAQSAEIMDKIIATPTISVAQAAYLVFVASGKLAEDATPEQAYTLVEKLGWLGSGNDAAHPVRSAEYAYLLTRSYDLRGGLLSMVFRSPRYSYRDLVARGIFSSGGDPDDALTGVEAVRLLGQVMDTLPEGANQ